MNAYIYPTVAELTRQLKQRRQQQSFETIFKDLFNEFFGAEILSCVELEPKSKFFIWRSHNGKRIPVTTMATPHLFYAFRMIYNHTVPPAFRVLGYAGVFHRYTDVPHWTDDYKKQAICALNRELHLRDDLDDELQEQLDDMRANTEVIEALAAART